MKVQFTDQNFEEEVIKKSQTVPVLMELGASWCGPCRLLEPVLDDLAKEYDGKVVIGSLDVDANQQTASKYSVMSIPTVLFFKNGQVVKQMVGFAGKETVVKEINAIL